MAVDKLDATVEAVLDEDGAGGGPVVEAALHQPDCRGRTQEHLPRRDPAHHRLVQPPVIIYYFATTGRFKITFS